jgi:ethanolamine utilization protein EutQ (cupin superfamily)
MTKLQKKSLDKPDDVWTFEKGKLEVVDLGDVVVGRSTLEPGWSWEKCVKPVVKTNSCQVQHIGYMISGRMKVVMDDGTEQEYGPGDVRSIPPGHNAWVLGNEPVVNIDFMRIKDFSKLP